MQLNQSTSSYSIVLFIFTVVMAGSLLLWHTSVSHNDFISHQKEMAKYSVDGIAKELNIFIKQRKEYISRFAEDEIQLIRKLAKNPGNKKFQKELRYEVDIHIGSQANFTILDNKVRTLYVGRGFPMKGKQVEKIVNFPGEKHQHNIYSCKNSKTRCLVTMASYGAGNRHEGTFLVSFAPTKLARMLRNGQAPSHRLMLLHQDSPGLVEISEIDAKEFSLGQRERSVLTKDQIESIAYSALIKGSPWKLVDVPDYELINGHLLQLWRQSLTIFMVFFPITTAIFWFAKHEERKRNTSERKLGQVREQLQMALDFSNTGVWELDLDTKELVISDNILRDFSGNTIKTLSDYIEAVHPDDRECLGSAIEKCEKTGVAFVLAHRIDTGDGNSRWFELTGNREHQLDAYNNKMIGLMRDIGDQKKAEQDRMEFLEQQRDALVQEVHHRIKNNLQGVMALLKQHASFYPENREIFERAASQLHSVSLIHGLHSEMTPGKILLPELIMGICQSTSQMTDHTVLPEIAGDDHGRVTLADDKATLIALILNELVINAAKHGKNEKTQPIIVNLINKENTTVIVEIRNLGKISSPDFSFERKIGLGTGLRLVKILLPRKGASIKVQQLNGEVIWILELTTPVISFRQDTYKPEYVSQ